MIINNGHAPSQHLHIANLHQTCLGLVWRFAQDEPSCDGDIPANNFKLPYNTTFVCQHLSSILVSRWCCWRWYQIDLVSVGIPAVIKYLRQRASCCEMQCLMAKWCITAPSSGDELHPHCLLRFLQNLSTYWQLSTTHCILWKSSFSWENNTKCGEKI